MEPKDGSMGFDFSGTYTRVVKHKLIESVLDDGRTVKIVFSEEGRGVRVVEIFESESANNPEKQKEGWQAILDNFSRYVEEI